MPASGQKLILENLTGIVPDGPILATLAERDGQCICTWSPYSCNPDGNTVFRLRFRNRNCPALRHGFIRPYV